MKIVICYDLPKKITQAPKVENQINFLMKYIPMAGHTPLAMGFKGSPDKYVNSVRKAAPDFLWNLFDSFNADPSLAYMGAILIYDMGIPYAGSKTQAILFTADMTIAKSILSEAGIPTPGYYAPGNKITQISGSDWLLKPISGKGQIFSIKVSNLRQLQDAIIEKAVNGEYYAEQALNGRRFTAALLHTEGQLAVINVGEFSIDGAITFGLKDYSLNAKIKELSLKCARLFDLKGFATINFIVDDAGVVYVSSINPRPELTETGLFTQACLYARISPAHMLSSIIKAPD